MRRPILQCAVCFTLLAMLVVPALGLDVEDLEDLVGYTVIEVTNVSGEFEGADFDKPVKLDNDMIFEFQEYNYDYSYSPAVAVFARRLSAGATRKPITVYKLLIEDEIYDVLRLR